MKTLVFAVLVAVGAGGSALAQAQLVPTDDTLKGPTAEDVEGWNPSLGLTSTISLVSNSHVVGQVDGFSTMFGLGVVGGLDYAHQRHLVRTTLSISESFARTPVIDEFVKTNDVVSLEGLYNYFVTSKLGGYGRLKFETSAFRADDVRGVLTSWVEKPQNPGDPVIPLTQNSLRQRLADPFHPFTVNESVGGFAEPIHREILNLSVRAGIGGRHTLADTVRLIDDDSATPEVELLRLSNVHQLGIELFAGANGKLKDGKVDYRAGVSVLLPYVNNDKFDRSASALTRIGLESSIQFKVYDWMSIVYSLNITRDPQLFAKGDELTQVQNNLLLTFQFSLIKKKAGAKAPSEDEQALADARARADAAETARAAAEQRAIDLEQQLEAAKAECAARPCDPTLTPTTPTTGPTSPASPIAPTSPTSPTPPVAPTTPPLTPPTAAPAPTPMAPTPMAPTGR